MIPLESKIKKCEIEIKAGPGGENSDVYAWINSRIPSWAKSVDDPTYNLYTEKALETAKEIVRKTGRDITLKLSVDYCL